MSNAIIGAAAAFAVITATLLVMPWVVKFLDWYFIFVKEV